MVRECSQQDVISRLSHHGRVLHQCHVVAAERHDEQDRPYILETANPLPPLRPLPAHIIHPLWRKERERKGGREGGRDRERQRERETERPRERQRERDKGKQREIERDIS